MKQSLPQGNYLTLSAVIPRYVWGALRWEKKKKERWAGVPPAPNHLPGLPPSQKFSWRKWILFWPSTFMFISCLKIRDISIYPIVILKELRKRM